MSSLLRFSRYRCCVHLFLLSFSLILPPLNVFFWVVRLSFSKHKPIYILCCNHCCNDNTKENLSPFYFSFDDNAGILYCILKVLFYCANLTRCLPTSKSFRFWAIQELLHKLSFHSWTKSENK